MSTTTGENIRDWLRDAHAMEEQMETVFSGQADKLKQFSGLGARFETELNHIREHKILLSGRVQQLGSSRSVIKDTAAKFLAGMQNLSGITVSDEPVKGILALHTLTHMAIGSYKILIAATEVTSDQETKRICESILAQTESRAQWIELELETVTKTFLTHVPNVAP